MRCSAKHDRVSAISCVTLSPQAMHVGLYYWLYSNRNVHGEEVVEFLKYLTAKVPGAWTVVWDRSNIHRKAKVVRAWLLDKPDIVVEDFPGYTPDLNPDEGVWGWAKYGRLANLAAENTDWLRDFLWEELEPLKHRPDLLEAFIRETELPGLVPAA